MSLVHNFSIERVFFVLISLLCLVPRKASAEQFWTRYRFRLGEAEEQAARRERFLENSTEVIDDRLHDLNLTWAEGDPDCDADEPVLHSESCPAVEPPPNSEAASEVALEITPDSEGKTDQGDWDDWS